jgi:hypothetical protein
VASLRDIISCTQQRTVTLQFISRDIQLSENSGIYSNPWELFSPNIYLNLKMEAIYPFETSVYLYRVTRHYVPQDFTFNLIAFQKYFYFLSIDHSRAQILQRLTIWGSQLATFVRYLGRNRWESGNEMTGVMDLICTWDVDMSSPWLNFTAGIVFLSISKNKLVRETGR